MPTTTFHLNEELLHDIDRAARDRGMSRNRFVVQACREALDRRAGEWPRDFFSAPVDPGEAELLEGAVRDMESVVLARRRNRGAVAL